MTKVRSWGRLTRDDHRVEALSSRNIVASTLHDSEPGIPYGMGRSYGDVCLNPSGVLWTTRGLDHFISFDRSTGRMVCEAGVLLRDIQRLVIPCGWILPVTPGTQMVTVGGAIANDVHGKNHHVKGSFGNHVRWTKLIRTSGQEIECGPELRSDWFSATVGGMGLTGVIVEAEIQLQRVPGPWLATETIPYANLDEFFALADNSEREWEHTVAWIDCLSSHNGRGIFMRASPTNVIGSKTFSKQNKTMPEIPFGSLVNQLTVRPFNSMYFNLKKLRAGRRNEHYEKFFYPLDNLHEWNRMYGPKGFYQYQSVIPRNVGKSATQAMLKEIARSGTGSFLAVLKTFGAQTSIGMMSFPMPGVTLALDFPNNGNETLNLLERLDAIVREASGRIYPAKDARMSRTLFEAGYQRLEEFLTYRDPGISSAMSRRLMGS